MALSSKFTDSNSVKWSLNDDRTQAWDVFGVPATSEQFALIMKGVRARERAKSNRQARDQAMRDIGLVRVKGNLGGTYWE